LPFAFLRPLRKFIIAHSYSLDRLRLETSILGGTNVSYELIDHESCETTEGICHYGFYGWTLSNISRRLSV